MSTTQIKKPHRQNEGPLLRLGCRDPVQGRKKLLISFRLSGDASVMTLIVVGNAEDQVYGLYGHRIDSYIANH